MTHFANADDVDHPLLPITEQIRRFEWHGRLAGRAACRIRPACCCITSLKN
jgi:alanine racemase